MDYKGDILRKLERDGAVDLFVSEEEYDFLKKCIRWLWRSTSWMSNDHKLLLAFFRGYTFYKDLSENESAFWKSFHEELRIQQDTPQNTQYDNLWNALSRNEETRAFRIRDEHGRRQFVKTIDAIWGIRSFKASEVVPAFINYYRKHPGKAITPEIMGELLDFADDTSEKQRLNYHRVFKSMTAIVDHILDYDLAVADVDQLEQQLLEDDVVLGEPNALRYFSNKSQKALSEILGTLRFQRTPEQFKRHLLNIPLHHFKSPTGHICPANELAKQAIVFGEYCDLTDNKSHHIVPAARISLAILKRLPKNTSRNVAGLEVYISEQLFTVETEVGIQNVSPIYFGSHKAYIWVGKVTRGKPLYISGEPHPKALGTSFTLSTKFRFYKIPLVTLLLELNIFQPEGCLTLSIGNKTLPVSSAANQHFEMEATRSSIPIKLNDEHLVTWRADSQVFTEQGNDITRKKVQTHNKRFWVLGEKPATSSNGHLKQISLQPELWQVDWLDTLPFTLNSTHITYLNPTLELTVKNKKQRKIRPDIKIIYNQDCYIEGEPVEFTVPIKVSSKSQLKLDGKTFPIINGTVYIQTLLQGSYQPELVTATESILLPEIKVMPAITWDFPKETLLVEGKTYAATLTSKDGRFKRFRWKPRLNELAEALPSQHSVTIDDDITVSFELVCKPYTVRILDLDKHVLSKLADGQLENSSLQVINPYARDIPLQLRLSSEPERTYSKDELGNLAVAAHDRLVIEACLDRRSKNWVPVRNIPISCFPTVEHLEVHGDRLECRIEGCSDTYIRIEEYAPAYRRTVTHTYKLAPSQRHCFSLKHPYKFSSIHVRVFFSFDSALEEKLIKEFVTVPYACQSLQLERGIAWSKSNSARSGSIL